MTAHRAWLGVCPAEYVKDSDTPQVVAELTPDPASALRTTTYGYDLNSNLTSLNASRPAQPGDTGGPALGRAITYQWDARNLLDSLTTATSPGTSTDPAAARTWDYTWNSRGLLQRLTKPSAADAAGSATGNLVDFRYYANSLMRSKTETTRAGDPVASHELTYNPDGDLERDIARLTTPDGPRDQTVRYTYTPTQKLRKVTKDGRKSGPDEAYVYDPAGNITRQTIGRATVTYDYLNNRLKTAAIAGGGTSTYRYDDFGRLDGVTGVSPATYTYDGYDRIIDETHGTLRKQTSYDPFDRATLETVTKGGSTRKTRFTYLGLTEQVAAEEQQAGTGAWQLTKTYVYDADGKPLALTSTPIGGSPKTRYYSTSPRGDTEALTNPDTGNTTATYRYTAYGAPDPTGTTGEDTAPTTPTVDDVLNPYRYNSKRMDPATGQYDMGFRNYDPGLNTFLTRDMYNGALADMLLGLDPWNTNRYAYAGGNPITRVELDGHMTIVENASGGTCGRKCQATLEPDTQVSSSGQVSRVSRADFDRATAVNNEFQAHGTDPAMSINGVDVQAPAVISTYYDEHRELQDNTLETVLKAVVFDPAACDQSSPGCVAEIAMALPTPAKVGKLGKFGYKYADDFVDAMRGTDRADDAANGGRRSVAIGEDMANRVEPFAKKIGADTYKADPTAPREMWMKNNRDWIRKQMDDACTIYDCGPAPGRSNFPNPTSPYYQMELDEIGLRNYPYYIRVPLE